MAEIETQKQDGSNPNGNTSLAKQPIELNGRGMVLRSMDDLWRFAHGVVQAQMAPKSLDTPAKIVVAIQAGAELGLTPMVALNSIGVIGGKVVIYGDAPLGLIRRSGHLEAIREWIDGDIGSDLSKTPDAVTAHCEVKRKGQKPAEGRFSVRDARRAGLWRKSGPWQSHPQNMLKFKARYILRDVFGDVLMGFYLEGEIESERIEVASRTVPTTKALIADEPTEQAEATTEQAEPINAEPVESCGSGGEVTLA